ncbi:MAG: AMP-binding protein [Chloroflexi bacterium]|nr:AMP-binding protein [Chloroflexota bacterium]
MTDYEACVSEFSLEIPEYFNFGFDVIDRWAEDHTKLALVSVDPSGSGAERHTFWDLKVLSNKFGNVLGDMETRKGDRAFIMLPRLPEWYICMLGMMKVGVIPMPATVLSTPDDIEYRLNTAQASVVITDEENAAKVDQIKDRCPTIRHLIVVGGKREGWTCYDEVMAKAPPRLGDVERTRSDDPLLLYFTSGTTGMPKMVIHTQASYGMAHLTTAKFWQDIRASDLQFLISDTGWAKVAYGAFFGQWSLGACILQHNAKGKFDPALALGILDRYGVTTFCAPPTAYRMLVLEDLSRYDLSSLRHCTSAGEPLNPEVMKLWEEGTGLPIYDGYGQTETVLLVGNYPCLPIKPGSMGKPVPGYRVAIVDDAGRELGPGQEGQIALRVSPDRPVGLFREYWKDPEEMAKVFRGDWYYTGDRATMDEDGYLWFVGRADDVIITAGYRIGPFEVESALLEHPAVAESAVVAAPDELRGSIVKAFVTLAPGHVPSEELVISLQDHVKRVTAPYKYPRKIEFVSELPKTVSGKIRRVELRDRG